MCEWYSLFICTLVCFCNATPHRGVQMIDVDQGLTEYSDTDYDLDIENEIEDYSIYMPKIRSHIVTIPPYIEKRTEPPKPISELSHKKIVAHTEIKHLADLIQKMPTDGSLHIHTAITLDEQSKIKNRNHFYICDSFLQSDVNKICNATRGLLKQFDDDDGDERMTLGNEKTKSKTIKKDKKYKKNISLKKQEENMLLGHDVQLTKDENTVNELIMRLKNTIINERYEEFGAIFPRHFFEFKDEVKNSQLYKIIKAMPKGGLLYAHDLGILGPDYLLEITYQPHLYVCFRNEKASFQFSDSTPLTDCESSWASMEDARYSAEDTIQFDKNLRKQLSLVTDHPKKVYSDRNIIWKRYRKYFETIKPLVTFKPVWEKYIYDSFKAFRDDNIMYVEIRSNLVELYDLEGNILDSMHTAAMFKKILEEFKADYPDFYGAKLIYTPQKMSTLENVVENIQKSKRLKEILPDFFAGLDLVGLSGKGKQLNYVIEELEKVSNVEYFYHTGQTHCQGWNEDNLFEAISLQVKRIGHIFGIMKHPLLLKEVRKNHIALEVNVVANMVMGILDDVRNHPLAQLLARRMPVVLTSDDPGVWGADPISHDFYITFVGIASQLADIRLLKKLAINSILYSDANNKNEILQEFYIRWLKFIETLLE